MKKISITFTDEEFYILAEAMEKLTMSYELIARFNENAKDALIESGELFLKLETEAHKINWCDVEHCNFEKLKEWVASFKENKPLSSETPRATEKEGLA